MNFKEIFSKQKELDKTIALAHNIKFEETKHKKILALLVELGELANEVSSFKYWKKNKNIDREKIIEEFVDGIHFYVSFANHFDINSNIQEIYLDDINNQFIEIFKSIIEFKENMSKENLNKSFSFYMGIPKFLNISEEEIKSHYFRKNKINFERVKNNY